MKTIKINRDSVAAGDDINSHLQEITIQSNWKISDIIKHIILNNYLPLISGGKATWSVAIENPIAILTQETKFKPKLICMPEYPYSGETYEVNIEQIHFNYHAQEDPENVYKVLRRFKLPRS